MKGGEKLLQLGQDCSGCIALSGSRSEGPDLKKVNVSIPARLVAQALTSERTTAREAPCIRLTYGRATMRNKKGQQMKEWKDITHCAGFDWARHQHAVVVVDREGQIVSNFRFDHSAEGWKSFREKTAGFENLAVAIETNQGAAVDQLLQIGCTLYPVNTVAAARYRERKAPSGNKTDYIDAWALGDALRVDGHGWKRLAPMDKLTVQLRLLCRDEVALIEQRTALVNQLEQALVEYYPAALEAFDDWTQPSTWSFIIHFPTPQALTRAGRRRWEKFLHSHRLWRPGTVEKRLAAFEQVEQLKASEPIVKAKSQLAVSLCQLLRTLERQLEEYRKQIEELFSNHPDHDLFGSLPGAKEKLAPRLLAAIGNDPTRFGSFEILQRIAGTAPSGFESSPVRKAQLRWACDKFLRATVHLWADCFWKSSAWGRVYYRKKRKEGKSHACALRCLAQRLLKILFRMLTDRKPYDAELHARNQLAHGSWVIALLPKPASAR
jgi:transposase